MHIIYVIIYCCCWGRGFKAEHAENGKVHCLIDDTYAVVQGPKQGSGSRHPVRSYYHELMAANMLWSRQALQGSPQAQAPLRSPSPASSSAHQGELQRLHTGQYQRIVMH